jgi:hypothetical protein
MSNVRCCTAVVAVLVIMAIMMIVMAMECHVQCEVLYSGGSCTGDNGDHDDSYGDGVSCPM